VRCWTYRLGCAPLTWNHEQKAFQRFGFWNPIHILREDLCKIALNMAEDENRHGHIFMSAMPVEPTECDAHPGRPETS
jgi:hypothetical protein